MNNKKKISLILEMLLYIITFISFFLMIFASLKAYETIKIIRDDFYSGIIKVTDFDCIKRHSSNSSKSDCYALGTIYSNSNEEVCKNQKLNLGIHSNVDFTKKSYNVFYRKNCKFPIWNKDDLYKINKSYYWYKLALLFLSHIVFSILLFIIIKINR